MGLITWIAIAVIALVVIGLGRASSFSGLIRGAEIIGNNLQCKTLLKRLKNFSTITFREPRLLQCLGNNH